VTCGTEICDTHQPHPPDTQHSVGSGTDDLADVDNVTSIRLWLPSDLPASVRHIIAPPEVISAENDLLLAQLHDSLVAIRKMRQALSTIHTDRKGDANASSSNEAAARQRERVTGVGVRIEEARLRYVQAWDCLSRLDPGGKWLETYRRLEKKDI
jgi:hypothetical protein